MAKQYEGQSPDWDLDEWEQALTINVGAAFVCRLCGNVVMVTRGGVGIMELLCCGNLMERLEHSEAAGGR